MSELIVVLVILAVIALIAVAWAVRGHATQTSVAADTNADVFHQRLTELKADRDNGMLDSEQFEQLETELQRQLLAEAGSSANSQTNAREVRSQRMVLWAVVLVTAALSALLYRQLGAWPDIRFSELQQSFSQKERFSEADMQALAEAIDTSLKFRPDQRDLRFWRAQLAVEQGDFAAAVANYRQLLAAQPNSPTVMAQLAQALFLQNGRQLDDEARMLMRRAAKLDPAQTTALGMLGIDAFDRGEYNDAIDHWTLLLQHISPQAPQAEVIRHALERAKQMAGAGTETAPQAKPATEESSAVATVGEEGASKGIRVVVRAGPHPLPENGMLYVFAKAAEGPGFPLAVVRQAQGGGAEWPQAYTLTPADSMRPDMTLDQFDRVRLTARFSQSGSVMAASGDIEGSSRALNWRTLDAPVELVLDTRVP